MGKDVGFYEKGKKKKAAKPKAKKKKGAPAKQKKGRAKREGAPKGPHKLELPKGVKGLKAPKSGKIKAEPGIGKTGKKKSKHEEAVSHLAKEWEGGDTIKAGKLASEVYKEEGPKGVGKMVEMLKEKLPEEKSSLSTKMFVKKKILLGHP